MKINFIGDHDFLSKITVIVIVLQCPINKINPLFVIQWLQFLGEFNLIGMQMQLLI